MKCGIIGTVTVVGHELSRQALTPQITLCSCIQCLGGVVASSLRLGQTTESGGADFSSSTGRGWLWGINLIRLILRPHPVLLRGYSQLGVDSSAKCWGGHVESGIDSRPPVCKDCASPLGAKWWPVSNPPGLG